MSDYEDYEEVNFSYLESDQDDFSTDEERYEEEEEKPVIIKKRPTPSTATSRMIAVPCGEKNIQKPPLITGSVNFIEETVNSSGIAQGLEGEERAYGIEEIYKKSRLGNASDLTMTTFSDDPRIKALMIKTLKSNPRDFHEFKLLSSLQSATFSDYLDNKDKEKLYKYLFYFLPTESHYKYFNVLIYVLGYIVHKKRLKNGKIDLNLLDKLYDEYRVPKLDIYRYTELVSDILMTIQSV